MPQSQWPPAARALGAARAAIARCRPLAGAALAPAFGHWRQAMGQPIATVARAIANPSDDSELGVEFDIEAGGDLKPGILQHMRSAPAAPRHYSLVAGAQQRCNLRAKQLEDRSYPAVDDYRGTAPGDDKAIQHLDYVFGPVPRLAGNPAVGRKQTD